MPRNINRVKKKSHVSPVLEMGTGEVPLKLTELALRHASTHFIGIDRKRVSLARALARHKAREKPINLDALSHHDAVSFLMRQPANHYGHAYSHFLLMHLQRQKRLFMMHQLYRVLKPGARYQSLEFITPAAELKRQLEQSGFRVALKLLSPEQVKKMGTEWSADHADYMNKAIFEREVLDDVFSTLSRMGLVSDDIPQEFRRSLLIKRRREILRDLKKYEVTNPNVQTRKSLARIVRGLRQFPEQPFCAITAVKPRGQK